MRAQGWQRDPYDSHEDRWFSDGEPTSLVRDQGTESYDKLPRGQLPLDPLGGDAEPPGRRPSYPPGPAGEHEGPPWAWWTVALPGVPALAVSAFICVGSFISGLMAGFCDSCDSPPSTRVESAIALQELILFGAVFVLFLIGLAQPASRRVLAFAFWGAIALAMALLPLNGA
jgi:hypothetical protein